MLFGSESVAVSHDSDHCARPKNHLTLEIQEKSESDDELEPTFEMPAQNLNFQRESTVAT